MSLKGRFKTSSVLVREGVWFDVDENEDGTKCRVKLRRSGRANPFWGPAFRDHTAGKDMETIPPEEDELITANVFAEANVVEWEHFQPEDDGVELEFSMDNVKSILTDPDWVELLNDWQTKTRTITAYQQKREGEAGN
jgi:hypothetical protein